MEMPNYLDYDKMLSMGPWAQFQANEQLDLAKLFQDQKLQQEKAATEKADLSNIYDRRTLEDRVQTPGLNNQALLQSNRSAKVKADIEEATYPEALKAKMAEYVKTKSDAELTIAENKIKRDLQSENPNIRAQAERAWRMSVEMRKMQQQHQDALALKEREHGYKLKEIDRQTSGQKEVANIRATTKGSRGSFAANVMKLDPDKQLILAERALLTGVSPETNQELTDVERIGYEVMRDKAVQLRDAANAAKARQGIVPQRDESGKIVIQNITPVPSVGSGAKPVTDPTVKLPTGYTPERVIQEAQAAIKAGKNREAVLQRVRSMGLSTQGL